MNTKPRWGTRENAADSVRPAVVCPREREGRPLQARLETLMWFASQLPFARTIASRHPIVLMYHSVPRAPNGERIHATVFERHVQFLKHHFEPVPPCCVDRERRSSDRIQVILTFDDGVRNNAEVVAPLLRRLGVPALFFVSTRHSEPGRYLWCRYLRALELWYPGDALWFRGMRLDMTDGHRRDSVLALRHELLGMTPHPHAMNVAIETELPPLETFISEDDLLDSCAGMTAEQVADLASDPAFSLGVHTEDHVYLTRCEAAEAERQIRCNRDWIEAVSGSRCRVIGYPSGDYDDRVLSLCRDLGFQDGYAVAPHRGRGCRLEHPRLGVYSSSLRALGCKAHWGPLMRRLHMNVG